MEVHVSVYISTIEAQFHVACGAEISQYAFCHFPMTVFRTSGVASQNTNDICNVRSCPKSCIHQRSYYTRVGDGMAANFDFVQRGVVLCIMCGNSLAR